MTMWGTRFQIHFRNQDYFWNAKILHKRSFIWTLGELAWWHIKIKKVKWDFKSKSARKLSDAEDSVVQSVMLLQMKMLEFCIFKKEETRKLKTTCILCLTESSKHRIKLKHWHRYLYTNSLYLRKNKIAIRFCFCLHWKNILRVFNRATTFLGSVNDCFMERWLGKPQEKVMWLLDLGCTHTLILNLTGKQLARNSNNNILFSTLLHSWHRQKEVYTKCKLLKHTTLYWKV